MESGAAEPLLTHANTNASVSTLRWLGRESRSAHLDDGGLADMLCHGGPIEDAVAVGGPLDVAQPAGPVRVAHQVGVERDRVVAGITCEHKRSRRSLTGLE